VEIGGKMRIKRYWVQNIRTFEEVVLDAKNLKEIALRTGWKYRFIRIMKVSYHRGPKSLLILLP